MNKRDFKALRHRLRKSLAPLRAERRRRRAAKAKARKYRDRNKARQPSTSTPGWNFRAEERAFSRVSPHWTAPPKLPGPPFKKHR